MPDSGSAGATRADTPRAAEHAVRPSRGTDSALGVLLAFAVMVTVAGANLWTAPETSIFLGALAIGPFVAAAFAPPRWTAAVAVFAVGLAFAVGALGVFAGTFTHLFRVVVVGLGGAFAVWVSWRREAQQYALLQVRHAARIVQEAILTPVDGSFGGVRAATRYRSASSEAVIGGDFYDVVETHHGVRMAIGDVRGKGLPAVRLATRAVGAFRAAAHSEPDLAAVVSTVEATLTAGLEDEEFVTMAVAALPGDGRLLVANCGHVPPLRWRDGAVEALEPAVSSPPLGLEATPEIDEYELAEDDRVLFCTDGITEARNRRGEFFDVESTFAEVGGVTSPTEALDRVLARLDDHSGGALGDDVALIIASVPKRAGKPEST